MADIGGIAGDRLRSFIERIERLEEERRTLSADIKEVYAEAKGTGFDIKTMRQIVRIRRIDKDDLDEQETLLDLYKRALGMLPEARPAQPRSSPRLFAITLGRLRCARIRASPRFCRARGL
jgi:uncharacterized protein (UPF0335 family)